MVRATPLGNQKSMLRRVLAAGSSALAALLLLGGLSGSATAQAASLGTARGHETQQGGSGLSQGALTSPAPGGPQVGTSAEGPFPGGADLTNPEPQRQADRNINFTIKADGLGLRDRYYHSTDHWSSEVVPPDALDTGHNGTGKVTGYAPGMVVAYQIYDAAGKATDYWIGAKFYSPFDGSFGVNQWGCVVYQGNPRSTGSEVTVLSPYACVWSNASNWEENPRPVLTVSEGTVVTDKAQAKQLLRQYCNTAAATKDCAYIPSGYSTALGESKVVGQSVTNNSDSPAKHSVAWSDESSQKNSVDVELSTEVTLWEVWKTSLSTKYGHEWETSHTFKETTEVDVKPHSISWLVFAPNMQATIGAWVINTDQHHYVIPSVSLTAPLPHGGSIVVNGCPLDHYHNGVCSRGLTTTVVSR